MKSRCRPRPGLGALLLAAVACTGQYDAPPTHCDYWCRATQRDCDEDNPVICVLSCEQRLETVPEECLSSFEAITECYQSIDSIDFICINDRSQPPPTACQAEELILSICQGPARATCFNWCETVEARCPDFDTRRCLERCAELPVTCASRARNYFNCRRDRIVCPADLRSADCIAELETWAACEGIDPSFLAPLP